MVDSPVAAHDILNFLKGIPFILKPATQGLWCGVKLAGHTLERKVLYTGIVLQYTAYLASKAVITLVVGDDIAVGIGQKVV